MTGHRQLLHDHKHLVVLYWSQRVAELVLADHVDEPVLSHADASSLFEDLHVLIECRLADTVCRLHHHHVEFLFGQDVLVRDQGVYVYAEI